jgi:zinc protease
VSTTSILQSSAPVVLKNGLTVYVLPLPHAPRLALNLYLKAGNRHEPVSGLQDMIDRLLLKGTTTRNQEAMSLALDNLSTELDTETRRDCSILEATMLPEDWLATLELLADVWTNATFEEFDREKDRLAGEIAMDLDAPRTKASDTLTRSIFPAHPYGVTGSVILEALPRLNSVEALTQQYKQAFNPATATMVLAGPLPANWQADLERHLPVSDQFSTGSGDQAFPFITPLTHQRIHVPVPDSAQCHIFQGWLLPPGNHEDYTPLSVLNTILGGAGLSSRLFTELRDKQGLAYNVRSSLEGYRECGVFSLYIGTEPKNLERCIDGFAGEIQKLVDIPVPDRELEEAKLNAIGRRALGLETAHQQAALIGNTLMLGRDLNTLNTYEQRVKAVTSADIQRVAQRYLTAPFLITYAGP